VTADCYYLKLLGSRPLKDQTAKRCSSPIYPLKMKIFCGWFSQIFHVQENKRKRKK